MTTSRTRTTITGCSQAEGDRICRMVLQLVTAIRADRSAPSRRPPLERIGPSADSLELDRLLRPAESEPARTGESSSHHPEVA